ncbi:FAS1-like dehydratase domain-containing protein [Bordetella bronchialis]|uniref:Acyl-CoA dehydrogenase n=1 Tax=Bordetella bronchialis TaxID=463025 RepID=A0ABM6CLX0_9BORD|nr:MaoC family dehydratase N-terminal domain-containing protein [Bordetella bronchialis]ANN64920.1 acyl-CoA dehydrogenase [Bordetella bronchialis]
MPDAGASLNDWLDKTETVHDLITPFPLAALAATLERPDPRGVVPPLWHWLYFLPVTPMSEVGPDGHARRGGFLPPVPLPRRMWAGGRLTFQAPLREGERATRTSTITHIEDKTGRSGRLVFVTVHHRYEVDGEARLEEEHDIVYRDAPPASPGAKAASVPGSDSVIGVGHSGDRNAAPGIRQSPALEDETWSRTLHPDAVLLFRYSALTFNSHRIHYDHPYVTGEEGYPGLIVHGPLIATLLVDLLRRERPDATLRGFAFRAMRPCFAGNALTVCGKPRDNGEVSLWTRDHEGNVGMQATATLA